MAELLSQIEPWGPLEDRFRGRKRELLGTPRLSDKPRFCLKLGVLLKERKNRYGFPLMAVRAAPLIVLVRGVIAVRQTAARVVANVRLCA